MNKTDLAYLLIVHLSFHIYITKFVFGHNHKYSIAH